MGERIARRARRSCGCAHRAIEEADGFGDRAPPADGPRAEAGVQCGDALAADGPRGRSPDRAGRLHRASRHHRSRRRRVLLLMRSHPRSAGRTPKVEEREIAGDEPGSAHTIGGNILLEVAWAFDVRSRGHPLVYEATGGLAGRSAGTHLGCVAVRSFEE